MNIKWILPVIALVMLVLSSLACSDDGTVIDSADSVSNTAQQVSEALEGDILNDANNALKDTLEDIHQIGCDIDNYQVGCPGYVAPIPIE